MTCVSQLYNFRKRSLSPDGDTDGIKELAEKLTRYNVSIPDYVSALKDTDVPW